VGKAAALSRARAVAALAATTGCHGSAQGSSPTVALNQEVRDGRFAFRVTRVDISTPNIGIQTAQGVFVVVDITVQNIGDEPRTMYCQTYDDAVTVGRGEDLINLNPGKRVLGVAR
jgi:hypothetical protein